MGKTDSSLLRLQKSTCSERVIYLISLGVKQLEGANLLLQFIKTSSESRNAFRNVLKQEEKPALYFYEQTFNDHGKKMTRRGFFAALKIENPHGGAVKTHEKTLSKPKADRNAEHTFYLEAYCRQVS